MFCHRGQTVVVVTVMNTGEVSSELVFPPPSPAVRSGEQTWGCVSLIGKLALWRNPS